MKRVIVIGAGLAGLSAARELVTSGAQVTILEAGDKPGGRVHSEVIDGYTIDYGFQVINARYPQVRASGILETLDFKYINPNFRLVEGDRCLTYGRSHPLSLFSQSPSKSRAAFEEFFTGVYLTHPSNVDKSVRREIFRSFPFGKPGVPALGVGEFTRALAVGLDIKYNYQVDKVVGNNVHGPWGELKADAIIVATTASIANSILGLYMPNQMNQSTTWYHSTGEDLTNAELLTIPRNSGVVNSIVISTLSSSYAPVGKKLIATTTLNNISEVSIKGEIARLFGAHKVELIERVEIKGSLPVMAPGSKRAIYRASENIVLAGDYLEIPSQEGAMRSGMKAAKLTLQLAH
jgi:phytoene dehydrogenase-like protein